MQENWRMELAGDALRFEQRGAVGVITLARPDQINAVNDAIRTCLPALLDAADRDPAIRVILIHGEGPRGFCAGADVKEFRGAETPLEAHRRLSADPWLERVAATRKPMIAALHGACMGGGCELALACDVRIAAPDTRIALPEVNLGLIPGGGGTQRLVHIVGLGRALDLLLTGGIVDGEAAMRIGLVSRLATSADTLLEEAIAVAETIASKPPNATLFVKQATRASAEAAAGLQLERALFGLLLTSEDKAEAAQAFKEKRKPNFTGR